MPTSSSSPPPPNHSRRSWASFLLLIRSSPSPIPVHAHLLKLGLLPHPHLRNALLHSYAQLGLLHQARRLFDELSRWALPDSNSLLSAYFKWGHLREARALFHAMPRRNVVTWTATVSGYARTGDLESARRCFDAMPHRTVVSWNAMLSGYSQNGFVDEFWSDAELPKVFAGKRPCYFNTGVMVMDLVRWREGDYWRRIEGWMEIQRERRIYELGSLPPFLLVFGGDIEPIDRRWNQHGLGGDNVVNSCRALHPGPVSLLHWSGKGKPWTRLDLKMPCPVDSLWMPYDFHSSKDSPRGTAIVMNIDSWVCYVRLEIDC